MSTLLINPPYHISGYRYPTKRVPYDLLYIDSYLYSRGEKVFYMDLANMPLSISQFCRKLQSFKADNYVINTTGRQDHFQPSSAAANIKGIIRNIRKYNDKAVIILTGDTSLVYTDMYRNFEIDCIVYSEPELTVYEVVKLFDISKLKDIQGIYYKQEGALIKNLPRKSMRSLDELPPPRWEKLGGHFWDSVFREKKEFIDIMGMRGCPFKCGFCKSIKFGDALYHSPRYILEQVNTLNRDFGYTEFFFRDACSFDESVRSAELCQELAKIKGITWKCNARIEAMTTERLKLMKDSGCSLIAYGIESSDERTLKIYKKGLSLSMSKEVVDMTRSVGIKVATYFILDFPGEGLPGKIRTILFAKTLMPQVVFFTEYYSLKIPSFNERVLRSLKIFLNMLIIFFIFLNSRSSVYFNKFRISRHFLSG